MTLQKKRMKKKKQKKEGGEEKKCQRYMSSLVQCDRVFECGRLLPVEMSFIVASHVMSCKV